MCCYSVITETLQEPDRITVMMQRLGALTKKQSEGVLAEKARWKKVEKLVDLISRQSRYCLGVFLEVLKTEGQPAIAEAIKQGNPKLGV